ncbi:hypothetical protein MHK74_01965 [Microbacterium aurum]|uniref:hypothetical protein n=1 Tax=Microbacterium aurum TaxID=36805 RepID=UPI001EF61359|nr:hypothetical protein [Microbacterium aurum]MCG7413359.1 hypothetical protein [Microbacterium aurum]
MTEFYMSLSPNDINAVRQEAYVLIPLRARDNQPAFWSWPHGYAQLPTGQFEFPVRLDDMGAIANSRIYFVPERSEFRLCSEQVYRLGPGAEGSILEVGRGGVGNYWTQVHAPGSASYTAAQPLLTHQVQNSSKRWGYS